MTSEAKPSISIDALANSVERQFITDAFKNVFDPDIQGVLVQYPASVWTPQGIAAGIINYKESHPELAASVVVGQSVENFSEIYGLLRENASTATLPVTDLYYAPLSMTRTVARRFSFIVNDADQVSAEMAVTQLGFLGQLATYQGKTMFFTGNYADTSTADDVYAEMLGYCEKAVTDGRAECVALLGSSGMLDPTLAPRLREGMAKYKDGTPQIIDPLGSAITFAQSLIANKLWSNRTFAA